MTRPPREFHNEENRHIMWRLNKATVYCLRSSPTQCQDRIAHSLTFTLELVRSATESNVYRSKDCQVIIYVGDLPFTGAQSIINTLFSGIQKEVLLRHTGDSTVGSRLHFLGRNISNCINVSLNNNYVDITLEESGMTTCNPASRMKDTAEYEAPLDHEQRRQHRRLVGEIQWLAYTRPDISYGAKELARALQAPTQFDYKHVKRMTRHLTGTRYMRHNLRPKIHVSNTGLTHLCVVYISLVWRHIALTQLAMDMQPITPLPMAAQACVPERYNDRVTTSAADIGFVRADNLRNTDHGTTAWHNLTLANNSNALYMALATEECISFVGDAAEAALEKIKRIIGNLRYSAFDFAVLVLTTNPHDAVMTTVL